MMSEIVNPKDLFAEVAEGDKIRFEDRDEPVTVYRHVTEDDLNGQAITMKEVTEEYAETAQWECENGVHDNDAIRAGDLMTGELTGDEFLIARGPRDGCYLLKQWWDKSPRGEWTADIALYRRHRSEGGKVFTWENTVDVEIVGTEDVNRDAFDANGAWVRHTELDGVTVWEDTLEGDVWDHSEALTGTEPRQPTDTGPNPVEVLEGVSEGDSVEVNGQSMTVTDVTDEYDGALADGVMLTLDAGGEERMVRTYADKGKAIMMGEDIGASEDVTDVAL